MMEGFAEHRASSFVNDAGLWRMLLEKAKKGTSTEPYFTADILEGSLQTSMFAKLGLPAAFLEHHRTKLTENIILEGPDGHKWPVMLGLSWDSKPCLLHGWQEFATDYNLAVNDQILFFLLEASHFLVQVFDSNHNIKRREGGTRAPIARTAFPQVPDVTDPIQSFRSQTTRPNISSLPIPNNDSTVAKNGHEENHTSQASPAGEKLGNQEPGVEEEDDRVADFNANSGEMVECFLSAPPSDAEEDQALSMERARNLNRETTDRRGGGELHNLSPSHPVPEGTLTMYDYLIQVDPSLLEEVTAISRVRVRKWKEPKQLIEEKIPEKRARQAPTDRSKAVSASTSRTRQARRMTMPSPDDPVSRATKSAPPPWNRLKVHQSHGGTIAAVVAAHTAKAREAAAAANKEGEATTPAAAAAPAPAPASDPVTPLSVEAPKQAFKRPQPRNPSQSKQLYFSKRRPVTPQEREAALEAGQRYAAASYNRTHVMQLRSSQVYCGKVLGGTLDFAAAMELPLQGHRPVTLYDETGRKWAAVWHGEHPKRTGLASSGWTSFVLDHFLEEGDVCVFELPDPKGSNICVTVFPVVPVTRTPSGWRNHYSVDEPGVTVPVPVPVVVQPEATLPGQSSSFETEDSGMEGFKQRRLSSDKSCEENKSNE